MRCLSRTPRLGVVSALIGLMCVSAQPAAAQASDALILGVVRDATGAVVSAATVWAHNRSTGNTWTTRTSSAGRYAFVQLPLGGPYDISVQKVGAMFEPRTTPELTLGARIVMDFTLRATATPLATQTFALMPTARVDCRSTAIVALTRMMCAPSRPPVATSLISHHSRQRLGRYPARRGRASCAPLTRPSFT